MLPPTDLMPMTRPSPAPLLALLALVGLLVLPSVAEAQSNQRIRQGFFIGAGLGFASAQLPEDTERRNRAAGMLRLGGSITPWLLVGGESLIYSLREPGNQVLFVTLTPTVWVYPLGETPLFLKAGVGLAVLERDLGVFGGTDNDGGLGMNAGFGWDLHVGGGSFALSPYVTWARGSFNAGSADQWQVGIGLTGF